MHVATCTMTLSRLGIGGVGGPHQRSCYGVEYSSLHSFDHEFQVSPVAPNCMSIIILQ